MRRRPKQRLQPDGLVERPPDQSGDLPHDGVQVDVLLAMAPEPGDGEELSGQLRGALRCLGDGAGSLLRDASGRRLRSQDVGVPEDPDQQVVEVVRHPAGEQPDRLELLRLPLRVLGAPLLGVRQLELTRASGHLAPQHHWERHDAIGEQGREERYDDRAEGEEPGARNAPPASARSQPQGPPLAGQPDGDGHRLV